MAVVHCSAGDLLITIITLLLAMLAARVRGWPAFGSRMILTTIVLGIGYTILSEWLNVEVWRNWAYTPSMPVLPWLGTGLTPLFQWLVVPLCAFAFAFRSRTAR